MPVPVAGRLSGPADTDATESHAARATSANATSKRGDILHENAAGRLVGTLLSGLAYLVGGIGACLWASCLFLLASWICSLCLPLLRNAPDEASGPGGHRFPR